MIPSPYLEYGAMNCKHKKLVFLGKQELTEKEYLPLFNCLDCHTTVTIRLRRRKFSSRSMLKKAV